MSINLLTAKFMAPCAATAVAVTGGGVGLGFYVNGSGESREEAPEYYHDYLKLDGLSSDVKTYLKSTDDFIEKKDTNTSVILARVLTAPNTDKNLIGKQLTCTVKGGTQENCTISLIQPNLTKTNIGKVLYSSLTPINNPKVEAPKDSYVVVEFTSKTSKIEDLKNKEIAVKEGENALMTVVFDQPLFKQTKTIGSEQVIALVPLKKNIVTYIAINLIEEKEKLFAKKFKPRTYSCSFIKKDSNQNAVGHLNVDDACKIIQLDFPTAKERKLMTVKEVLDSTKPLTANYKHTFFKIKLDSNKFFNFDDKVSGMAHQLKVKGVNGVQQTEEADFFLLQQIEDGKVKGLTKYTIAKYTGESKLLSMTNNESGKCFLTKQTSAGAGGDIICEIFLTTSPKEINKENFTQIDSHQKVSNQTITKGSYFIIAFWSAQKIEELMTNKSVYFYKKDASNNINTGESYEFEIAALLADRPDEEGQNILITEIPDLTK